MKQLNKFEKLDFILKNVKKYDIKAYEIRKYTDLTESGVRRIINGDTKRPHITSINVIYNYIIENYSTNIVNPNEPKMDVVVDENKELRDALLEHKDEIKSNFTNLMETLIKKIIAKETGVKFQHINESIMTLFRKQMDMDMELKKNLKNNENNGNQKIN